MSAVETPAFARAHPRSRGENELADIQNITAQGSSPLTRGKLHARNERPRHPGLIPAHAGKTVFRGVGFEGEGAHPRSRGENLLTPDKDEMIPGSSPLTRGKRLHGAEALAVRGLIPAHAGKTSAMTSPIG